MKFIFACILFAVAVSATYGAYIPYSYGFSGAYATPTAAYDINSPNYYGTGYYNGAGYYSGARYYNGAGYYNGAAYYGAPGASGAPGY